ncbi:hypothetical protein P5673_017604 [Acropora cervicornis]|uniref:Uncharacterized protein n=1 Tax=Acropora cervicornis TaxID=6130 RepID=A0AAD9QF37_ACRCE|nr:hypothetical protein P5673_017604 [Acropora cervicornis]
MFPARDRTFKIISDATSTTIIERLRELKSFDIFDHPLPHNVLRILSPGELSFSASRLNSQLSPSFTQQNFAEFSSESRIHASIYERVYCAGDAEEDRREELYVSRHLANEIRKSP